MIESKKLKDISLSIGSGITPRRDNKSYWENGTIPWLKTEQLVEKNIYDTNEKISQIALDETSIKLFPVNTLSMAMYGEGRTRGNVSILKKAMTTNQACCNIVIDSKMADYEFVYYYLKTQYEQLRGLSSGVRKNLNSNDIKEYEIRLPSDISTQQKIAAVLTALDAKIELNARINAELESMAKTVFRYQFVENKEKGNWKIGTLGDIAENIRRSANPNEIKPETHYIGLEHMPRKSIALADYGNASELESNKYAFKTGEFLFGKLRPYFHKVGIAPVDGVCSTDILVIAPKSPEWYGFVLGHISSDEIIKYADATSGGTKMPRTNWESLAKFEISIPPVETAKEFSEFFVPTAKQIRTNILESQTLTELRDWLLPMLMNGQVKIKG